MYEIIVYGVERRKDEHIMRRFYQVYKIQQTLSVKLSWSHYCELLIISDDDRRSFYEKECVRSDLAKEAIKMLSPKGSDVLV